ncbi:MAG TPA: guanylate kinase [Saprospiraceae bacterium]|jgi:guanylate kinase|nr:guanylate kinase [Saprospiraceae bacterium]HRO74063.1 guanylate kinase [Saprospiraceae bacterium]HRP41718.1 guanylate kinase [Saprospiraceae bacterium]
MTDIMTGKMFVFTAPSGAGKTTIVKHLLARYSELEFSVSAATRVRRPHEVDGRDYYFMSVDEFRHKIDQDAFVEWEEVYKDQYYGTLKSEVDRIWKIGKHIVFDIDVKGAMNIKSLYGPRCMSVFVRPPSFGILKERLINRNTETEASLNKRILKAEAEMEYENSFDIVLVNDVLEISLMEAEHIIETFLYGISKT